MTETTRRGFIASSLGVAGAGLVLAGAGAPSALTEELAAVTTEQAFWRLVQRQFRLEPGLLYFNTASLGPSPAVVADATESFRRTLDAHPSRWMWGGWRDQLEAVRSSAAELLGAAAEEIAIIHNTTEGMNLIAASLELGPGDEVIVADHEHPSGTIPWQYWQEPRGVRLVRPTLPLLPVDPGEIVEVYRRAITPRTRVISMCHVVNTTGMILPVAEVSAMARERGILVAVDGAQAPGHVEVDLASLGCEFYAASTHKWLFSPKGVGVLFARRDSQRLLKPLVVTQGWQDETIRRLENYNTRNLPEVLGLGVALEFQRLVGPERRTRRLRELSRQLRAALGDDPRFAFTTPTGAGLSAGITTVEVLGREAREVAAELAERHHLDCRPMTALGLNGLRISMSVFTTEDQVEVLTSALRKAATA